jgi:hypothetical protein
VVELLLLAACGLKDVQDDTGATAPVALPEDCSALPAQDGATLGPDDDLRARVASGPSGEVFLLTDGTYDLTDGTGLVVPDGVTVRSASGDATAVVLAGGFATTELVQLGDGATLAELTLAEAYADAVSIHGHSDARVYGVHIRDTEGRGVAIIPDRGAYADRAVIGCTTVVRSAVCDVAIEGVQTEGTRVYGASVPDSGCDATALRFATGSKDVVIERSVVYGGAQAIQLGDEEYGAEDVRAYDDVSCEGTVGLYGGVLRNTFVLGGVRVEDSCGTTVVNNTVWGSPLEWAFSADLTIANNLATLSDFGGAVTTANMAADAAMFADADAGDLHLVDGAAAIDAADTAHAPADDIDGAPRGSAPDIGADER